MPIFAWMDVKTLEHRVTKDYRPKLPKLGTSCQKKTRNDQCFDLEDPEATKQTDWNAA
jgi:hypothetical protein